MNVLLRLSYAVSIYADQIASILCILVFLYAVVLTVRRTKKFLGIHIGVLISAVIAVRLLAVVVFALAQYYGWSQSPFTNILLHSHLDHPFFSQLLGKLFFLFDNQFGYFFYYVWGRFALHALISIIAALAFYLFLLILRKYQDRFFDEGEIEIGFLMALIIGWPDMMVFIPGIFVCMILISLVRLLIFKETYTTVGYPILLSALIVFLWGAPLVHFLHLDVLKV